MCKFAWKDRPRKDLYCVGSDVEPYSLTPKVCGHSTLLLHSSNEPDDLLQWRFYDDSTRNIVLAITVTIAAGRHQVRHQGLRLLVQSRAIVVRACHRTVAVMMTMTMRAERRRQQQQQQQDSAAEALPAVLLETGDSLLPLIITVITASSDLDGIWPVRLCGIMKHGFRYP